MTRMEDYLQEIVQLSLGTNPEQMLKKSLEICIELAQGSGGSILGEEGPYLQFLFSDVEKLIGVRVPFDSIAGVTVVKNRVVYTHAPSDKRHFSDIEKHTEKRTNYLLSIPIPSIHASTEQTKRSKNAGTLQILFNDNIFPDIDVSGGAWEIDLLKFKHSDLYDQKIKNIFWLLPMITFGMEVMKLRQTSYQVIHELKNKMISSLSWLGYLREDVAGGSPELMEDEDVQEDFNLSESAIREGAELAKNYLQFTKIYSPNFEACDVNAVLRETGSSAKAFASELKAENFDVVFDLDDSIQAKELDADKLKMAFFNLCKNAVEILSEKEIENPKLTIKSLAIDDGVEISVSDNGPGMPKEIADNLFIPFKTKKEGGTGLGLTITKKIVDLHGGSIRCETDDSGTTFVLTL